MPAIWWKRRGNILIVSDDCFNVGLIATEIARLGFLGATIMPNVKLAKRCLDDGGTFRGIIVDLQAGHIKFCRSLRAKGVKMPMVVMVDPAEDVETLRSVGLASDYVRRPVRACEVVARTIALIHEECFKPGGSDSDESLAE